MSLVNKGFRELSLESVVLEDWYPLTIREKDLETIFGNYDKLYEEMARGKREEFKLGSIYEDILMSF